MLLELSIGSRKQPSISSDDAAWSTWLLSDFGIECLEYEATHLYTSPKRPF